MGSIFGAVPHAPGLDVVPEQLKRVMVKAKLECPYLRDRIYRGMKCCDIIGGDVLRGGTYVAQGLGNVWSFLIRLTACAGRQSEKGRVALIQGLFL